MKLKTILSIILPLLCITPVYALRRFDQYWRRGERPIMVIITSYNNAQWYKRNLDSVYEQKYENYFVVYIDDASTDGTYDLVCEYVKERGQQHRTIVFRNKENVGSLYGIYHAARACDDGTIVLTHDGDDWWAHDKVLARINEAYDDPNVYLTYGQYVEWPQEKVGQCREFPEEVIKNRSYRRYPWISSQQRTFYAGLFKRIKKEDCMHEGTFFRTAADVAIMFPILEMIDGRHKFISDIIYVYNQTPHNDFRIRGREQFNTDIFIRKKQPYEPLSEAELKYLKDDTAGPFIAIPQEIDHGLTIEEYHDLVEEARAWPYQDFDVAMKSTEFWRTIAICKQATGIDGKSLMALCRDLYNRYNPSVFLATKEPTIPKIIHQIWVGGEPPEELLQFAQTVQKFHEGRGWTYKLWRDSDVEKMTLYNQELYDATPNFGAKADLLRAELLYRYGGVYIDMDCEVIKPLDELHHRYDFYVGLQPLDARVLQLGIGAIGARPQHPIIADYMKTVKDCQHHKGPISKTGTVPFGISFYRHAGRNGSRDICFPAPYFLPLESKKHLHESPEEIKAQRLAEWLKGGSYMIHYWAGVWMPGRCRRPHFRSIKNDAYTDEWDK